jgi:hypothetical protein
METTERPVEEPAATAEFWREVDAIVEWAEHAGVRVGQPPLVEPPAEYRAA